MSQHRSFALSWLVAACTLLALHSSAHAQGQTVDIDLGRMGFETLAVLSPSLVYRPTDMAGVRPDARALGMGGAYVAMANDPLAIAWNPAGIAGIHDFTLAVDGFGVRSHSTAAGYPPILSIPRVPELFVTSYENALKSTTRYGTIALGVPLWERGARSVVGGFSWRRYAEVGRPEETLQTLVVADAVNTSEVTIALDRREKGAIESYGPTLGLRLLPGLDLGLTANFLTGRNRVSQSLEQQTGGQGLSDLGFERFSLKYRGFAFDLGARYSIKDRARFALRFTPEYTLEVTDGGWENQTIDVTSFINVRQFGTLSGYDQTIPSFFDVGGALRPFDRLWISAGYAVQNMSESVVTYTGAPSFNRLGAGLVAASVSTERIDALFGGAVPAGSPIQPTADFKQISVGAEYVLLRRAAVEVPVRVGFRSADLPFVAASPEDYSYRYLHEEVLDFLGLDYEQFLRLYDPSWDSNSTRARKMPKYETIGLVYNGPHGEQPTGTGISAGISLRTDRVTYDLGLDWFSYQETRFYNDSIWDPIFSPNSIEGRVVESTTLGEGENQFEVELPAPVRHPSVLTVDRSVTTFRFSATYNFPGLF